MLLKISVFHLSIITSLIICFRLCLTISIYIPFAGDQYRNFHCQSSTSNIFEFNFFRKSDFRYFLSLDVAVSCVKKRTGSGIKIKRQKKKKRRKNQNKKEDKTKIPTKEKTQVKLWKTNQVLI